jgi:hypothetical protein
MDFEFARGAVSESLQTSALRTLQLTCRSGEGWFQLCCIYSPSLQGSVSQCIMCCSVVREEGKAVLNNPANTAKWSMTMRSASEVIKAEMPAVLEPLNHCGVFHSIQSTLDLCHVNPCSDCPHFCMRSTTYQHGTTVCSVDDAAAESTVHSISSSSNEVSTTTRYGPFPAEQIATAITDFSLIKMLVMSLRSRRPLPRLCGPVFPRGPTIPRATRLGVKDLW